MIRGFWQSKLTAAGVFAASVVLAVLIWVRRWGGPIYIPIVASILMLAIGVLFGKLAGNLVAGSRNVKCLELLHMELDPEAFLKVYEGVPARFPRGSTDYAVSSAYLADGYAAAGEFDRAIRALCPPEACKTPHMALKGTYWQKLCSYQLFKGDRKEAAKALEGLDGVIKEAADKPELLRNLKESRRLLENRLALTTSRQVEEEWLRGALKKAPYKLLRLEILQALAQLALREGDGERAQGYLDQLRTQGGKTFFPRWAEERSAK